MHPPTTRYFDICSPACTGLGLEILRMIPLGARAISAGWIPRLWTFHPLVFNDRNAAIVPLQFGHKPLLPITDHSHSRGVFFNPQEYQNGPYVCREAMEAARVSGFTMIDPSGIDASVPGAYPDFIRDSANAIFEGTSPQDAPARELLYPADEYPVFPHRILLNLIGAHGTDKGLDNADAACHVGGALASAFPDIQFILTLHSRVCAGQSFHTVAPNLEILIHMDCDSRVARLLSPRTSVVSVEGGLAHAALFRGLNLLLVGTRAWLESTAFLYPGNPGFLKCIVTACEPDLLARELKPVIQRIRT